MAAAPVQMPFLKVVETVDLERNPPKSKEDEVDKFLRLERIICAHFVATSAMQPNVAKGVDVGGTHVYSYREENAALCDNAVLELAEQALRRQYGEVTLQLQAATSIVDVTWKRPLPQVDLQDQRNGQLFFYVLKNQMGLALKVIDAGAKVNARGPYDRTPLYAVMKEPKQLELLIGKKADIHVVDAAGVSPLAMAQFYGSASGFVKLLS